MIRLSPTTRRVLVALSLALGAPALLAPETAHAQRGRRGGAVVVQPEAGHGSVVVQPDRGRPGRGAVVVQPDRGRPDRGAVIVQPDRGRPGRGAVIVQPDRGRPGRGAVVVQPEPGRGAVMVQPGHGAVVVGPRGVVRSAPSRVVVVGPPPAPRVMTRRPAPSRHGEVWVEPYWGWTGSSWQWTDGRWEVPPQTGAIWVSPQWDGNGWTPGYWTMANVYQQTPQVTGMTYQVGQYTSGFLTGNDPRDASGSPVHDYAVWMSAGEVATFVASGGPSDRYAGRRVDVSLTLLLDGSPIASGMMSASNDAQVTFQAPRAAVYTLRIASRGGVMGTGTYILESSQGRWAPQVSPYEQYWSGQTQVPGAQVQVQVQPVYPQQQYPQQQYPQQQYPQQQYQQAPDCRTTLLQMGHAATNLMFCDNAEPYCAAALLRMGHAPTNLMFCQGVQTQCAVQLLESGRNPTELQFCR